MNRALTLAAVILLLGGCGPVYVRGEAASVGARLVKIVPKGSNVARLHQEAERRRWRVNGSNIHIITDGAVTWIDGCKGRGGLMVPIIIAEYGAPFATSVESIWMFDAEGRLADVCVRKTVDAL